MCQIVSGVFQGHGVDSSVPAANLAPPMPPFSSPGHSHYPTPGGVAHKTPRRTPPNSTRRSCPRLPSCGFCSSYDHRILYCPLVPSYIEQGKVVHKGCYGLVSLPNGRDLDPATPERNIQAQVNYYWAVEHPREQHTNRASVSTSSHSSYQRTVPTPPPEPRVALVQASYPPPQVSACS